MGDNKSGKRIIAIAVSPRAYGEILTLKGDRTWTKWLLYLTLLENPTNETLTDELLELVKAKTEKPKSEAVVEAAKPKAEPKPKRVKKALIHPLYKQVGEKSEAEPGIKYGYPDEKTGGTPVDINNIGRHEEV